MEAECGKCDFFKRSLQDILEGTQEICPHGVQPNYYSCYPKCTHRKPKAAQDKSKSLEKKDGNA